MDRTTVLPPLVHAALDVRDRLPWGPPATTPDGIATHTASVPLGTGGPPAVATRLKVDIPDVHASILALLFTRDIDHGDIAKGDAPLFVCDLETSSSSPEKHGAMRAASASNEESPNGYTSWLVPDERDSQKLEEALFVGGGENPEAEDCPTGFPDCHPSCCPIVPRESLTYFASETPKHRTRDFVIRMSPVVNLSIPSDPAKHHSAPDLIARAKTIEGEAITRSTQGNDDMTPRSPRSDRCAVEEKAGEKQHFEKAHTTMRVSTAKIGKLATPGISDLTLAREAASIPIQHAEAYAFATCSCSGAIPAVKRAVRGGLLSGVVISSATNETIGCTFDAFHVAAFPDAPVEAHVREHFQHYIEHAKFLSNGVFGGRAIDLQDPSVAAQAAAASRRKRLQEVRTAAAQAAGIGCCTLQ